MAVTIFPLPVAFGAQQWGSQFYHGISKLIAFDCWSASLVVIACLHAFDFKAAKFKIADTLEKVRLAFRIHLVVKYN